MRPFSPPALQAAFIAAFLLAYRATRKQTLSTPGAIAGFAVGFLLVATGWRGMNLFVFYQLGSMATKYKQSYKAQFDEEISQTSSSQRSMKQVLAVSVLAVLLSLYHAIVYGEERPLTSSYPEQTRLACAVLAHHATSLADTWASELGMLSYEQPRSILTLRKVPVGTNGGITVMGTIWSGVGGACIGLSTLLLDSISGMSPLQSARVVAFAVCCGLMGSLIDSLLGATLQATFWNDATKRVCHAAPTSSTNKSYRKQISGINILTNEQVNFVSLIITTFVGGWILGPRMFLR